MKAMAPGSRSRTVVATLVALGVVIAAVVWWQSRDDDKAAPTVTPAVAADQARYCQFAEQFTSLSTSTGAATAPWRLDGPLEAVAVLVEQMGPVFDEWQSITPTAVGVDVATVIDALEGDRESLSTPLALDAGARIAAYNASNCATGVGELDG